jgi:hypothetical protein
VLLLVPLMESSQLQVTKLAIHLSGLKFVKIIRNLIVFIALALALWIIWESKNKGSEINTSIFKLSIIGSILFGIDFIFSLIIKESVAKGFIISKEKFPAQFTLSIMASLIFCIVSVLGVIFFYPD